MTSHQMARRCITTRRVILLGILIAIGRITWNVITSFTRGHGRVEFSGGFPDGQGFDEALRPKGCIMTDNKSCLPEKPEDVYLGRGLYAHGNSFYLDGRPFRIFSGSFHYFRTQPSDWGDRLLKMKAAGLNTVTTYIPWNLHEPVKEHYVFSGLWDLASFIKQAQQVGLKVIIRPGPYICAEWEFGGLPAWLLRDPDIKVRTTYGPFLRHVEDYFAMLLPILSPLTYKKGGPIIAFQVENEYGSYGTDKDYLKFLVDQYKQWGIEELYFTSDGTNPEQLGNGTIPGILATANFKEDQKLHMAKLKEFQPDKPVMVTEFWPGWFDHWGEKHHNMTAATFREYLTNILEYGASVNFYMFVGGTNFEFWNGANMDKKQVTYLPTITSYDYDAPISEDGSLTEKFHITQELISKYLPETEQPIKINTEIPKEAYGTIDVEHYMPYQTLTNIAADAIQSKNGDEISREHPVSMEFLDMVNNCGQNVGFLLYRTEIFTEKPQKVEFIGDVRDRGQLILNGEPLATVYRNEAYPSITLPARPHLDFGLSHLDLLVENMGRVNYKTLNAEHKGLVGSLMIDGEYVTSWVHIPLEFDAEFVDIILQQNVWLNYPRGPDQGTGTNISCPAVFRAHLNLDTPTKDTYLDMYGWTKGIVILNGYILGRYWRIGPQRTLYIPSSLLIQGRNVLLIFELHQPHDTVTFRDVPMLNDSW